MEDVAEIDPVIVRELQRAAMDGQPATRLLALWQEAAGGTETGGLSRIWMNLYFREAYGWSLTEMSSFGAWKGFGESVWTDEMIDARISPLLEKWRTNARNGEEEE